jgi:hypothetical protein
MEFSCLCTFANKYSSTIGKIREKFRKDKGWGVEYQTTHGTKFLCFYNKPIVWDRTGNTFADIDQVYSPLLALGLRKQIEKRMKRKKCELCGTDDPTSNYKIHYIRSLKDIEGSREWERVMLKIRRKTLIVCPECYTEINRR